MFSIRSFEILQDIDLIKIGLRFAKMERRLGEINRARAIYQHLSQFCNPRIRQNEEQFWNIWEKFEVYHGNEDTYADYMRAKRTVELSLISNGFEKSEAQEIEAEQQKDLQEVQ